MKLVVQIPCFNEERTIAGTIAEIPRNIPGISSVAILVIDDGSSDATGAMARQAGADHVVRHRRNRGLAAAFRTGIDVALQMGADVIVNTDADNQYAGAAIPALVAPILDGRADLVIGDRQPDRVPYFSPGKRWLHRVGRRVVARISGVASPDPVSGFRAFSREAALQLNLVSSFSHTLETLVYAGKRRMAVTAVPVPVNAPQRPSRLFRSVPEFVAQSAATTARTYTMYKPLRVFTAVGLALLAVGTAPMVRFLVFFARGEGSGHVQSLVLGSALFVVGFGTLLCGVLADLIAFNRALLESLLERTRRLELAFPASGHAPERPAPQPVGTGHGVD
jgi:glycosyltransferase involved in cell wall biosynthesis